MSDEQDFQRAAKEAMDAMAKGQNPGDVLAAKARAAQAKAAEGAPGSEPAAPSAAAPSAPPDAAATEGAPPRALPINWDTEPTPAYVNGVQVVHSAQDFALLFTEMRNFPGRHAASGKAGDERASVAASLRMSPDVYFQMLCILTSNWNRYVTEYVDPRMRQPRFKLLDAGELQLDGIKKAPEE